MKDSKIQLSRIQKRRIAKGKIKEIINNLNNLLVIHYSCESFNNRPEGKSPRITSIAVKDMHTLQTKSFSIHLLAEIGRKSLSEIENDCDQLELEMLNTFYYFVEHHQQSKWLHWNMRDQNYGFEALAHRLRVLGGEPCAIAPIDLFDLARILVDWYGANYIENSRLEKLIDLNEITKTNFLKGEEEATAFKNKDYYKLHLSTLRKVESISKIFDKITDGTLKTKATFKGKYGNWLQYLIEKITDNWISSLLGLIIMVVTIILWVLNVLS